MQGRALAKLITSDKLTVVMGLGVTGLSVARYLAARNEPFVVVDSRANPPGLDVLRAELPDVDVELGPFKASSLLSGHRLVVSPGISPTDPAIVEAVSAGVKLTGDIELFMAATTAPVVAITGSNGKSTVTALVGNMAQAAGMNVGVGGNLGTPALDLLDDERDLYVLELSSFQLELVAHLGAAVATVLNISADHMDRYANLSAYHRAKHRIFYGVKTAVVNGDDMLCQPLLADSVTRIGFRQGVPDFNEFGVVLEDGRYYLAYERELLLPVAELGIKGRHNTANALAALALAQAMGIARQAALKALREFEGLPHRCQTVAVKQGVTWINDSKATNAGAAIAALEGLANAGDANIVWLAGGQGKQQDFAVLSAAVAGRVRAAILLGADAAAIAAHLPVDVASTFVSSMADAVTAAARIAQPGDTVLLSPACASFDMFSGFAHRGEVFTAAVQALP